MNRFDLRNENQFRPMLCELGHISEANGSAKLTCGQTIVVSRVYGPTQPKYQRHEHPQKATVEVEVTFSGESAHNSQVSQSQQLIRKERKYSNYVRRVVESSIQLNLFPKLFLLFQVTVVHDDGSALAVATNACLLSTLDSGIPMMATPYCISLSQYSLLPSDGRITSKVCSAMLVDPTKEEEMNAKLNIANFTLSYTNRILLPTQPHADVSSDGTRDVVITETIDFNKQHDSFNLVAAESEGVYSPSTLITTVQFGSEAAEFVLRFFKDCIKAKYVK